MISTRSATETRARIGLEGVGARSAARRIDRSAPRAPRARRAHRARRLGGEDDLLLRKHAQNSAGEPIAADPRRVVRRFGLSRGHEAVLQRVHGFETVFAAPQRVESIEFVLGRRSAYR